METQPQEEEWQVYRRKTLKWKQGHEKRSGRGNLNWIVEKETGEEAEELPEERGGWAEARRK